MIYKRCRVNPVNPVILSLDLLRTVQFCKQKLDSPTLAWNEHDLVLILRAEGELSLATLRHRIVFTIELHEQFSQDSGLTVFDRVAGCEWIGDRHEGSERGALHSQRRE